MKDSFFSVELIDVVICLFLGLFAGLLGCFVVCFLPDKSTREYTVKIEELTGFGLAELAWATGAEAM